MNGAKVLRVPLPMTEVVGKEMPNIEELETQEKPGILEVNPLTLEKNPSTAPALLSCLLV
jgi:hypothetical protein